MIAPRIARQLASWLVSIAALVLVALVTPTGPASAAPGDVPSPPEVPASGKGALTAADRDFVEKVRLAGLWEIPAGNMAQEKSDDPRIRAVGKEIARQHVILDELTREAAAELRIPLPDIPNNDQRLWLAEMRAASGKDFDQIYIDRLRSAHGKIFPAIALIRAGTRSDVVRRLAQQANQFVMTHLTLLESSGLVDYGSLPAPPQPQADPQSVMDTSRALFSGPNGPVNVNPTVMVLVLGIALIAGVVATVRILRPR